LDELFSHADDTLFQGVKLAAAYKPTH
jgi:hypothetical protein